MTDHTPDIPPEQAPPANPERADPDVPRIDPTNPPFEPVRKVNLPPDAPSPGVEIPGPDR
jgi:hypothetical protein